MFIAAQTLMNMRSNGAPCSLAGSIHAAPTGAVESEEMGGYKHFAPVGAKIQATRDFKL